jgi:hypothetical protein
MLRAARASRGVAVWRLMGWNLAYSTLHVLATHRRYRTAGARGGRWPWSGAARAGHWRPARPRPASGHTQRTEPAGRRMDDPPNRAEQPAALPLTELEAAVEPEAEVAARARIEPSTGTREKAAALAQEVAPGADPLFDAPDAAASAAAAGGAAPDSPPASERVEHVRDVVAVRAHQKTIEIRRVKVQGDASRRAPTQQLIRRGGTGPDPAVLEIDEAEAAPLQADDAESGTPHAGHADRSRSRLPLAVGIGLAIAAAGAVLVVLLHATHPPEDTSPASRPSEGIGAAGRGPASGLPPNVSGEPSASPSGAGSDRSAQGGSAAPGAAASAGGDNVPGAGAATASSAAGSTSPTGSRRTPAPTTSKSAGPGAPSSVSTAPTTSSSGLFFEKGSSDLNNP